MTKDQAYQRFVAHMVAWLPDGLVLKRYAMRLIDAPDPVSLYQEMIEEEGYELLRRPTD